MSSSFSLLPQAFTASGATFVSSKALTMNGAVTMTAGLTLNTLSLSGALSSSGTITAGAGSFTTLATSGTATVANLVSNGTMSLPLNTWFQSNSQNLFQLTGSTLAIQGGYNNVQVQTTSGTAICTFTNSLITAAQPILFSGNAKLPASGVLFGQVSGGSDVSIITWDSSGNTTLGIKAGQSLFLKDASGTAFGTFTTSGATLPGTLGVTGATILSSTLAVTSTTTLSSTLTLGTTNGVIQTTQSGSANGLYFTTWNGTTAKTTFSLGGQFNSALSYVQNDGALFVAGGSSNVALYVSYNGAATSAQIIGIDFSGVSGGHHWGITAYNDGTMGFHDYTGNYDGPRFGQNLIRAGGTYLGFKDSSGNKLAEMKSGGIFMANGAYQTAGGTTTISGSQSFDSFDYAECFAFDQAYPNGTVVCLDTDGRMRRCTHPGCANAFIISHFPGYMTGHPDETDPADHVQPVALMGRVKVFATGRIRYGDLLASNADGTLRAAQAHDRFILGHAITLPDDDGRVGILLRPSFR